MLLPLVISSLPGLINAQCLGATKGPEEAHCCWGGNSPLLPAPTLQGDLSCHTSGLSCPHRHSSEKSNGSVSCVK